MIKLFLGSTTTGSGPSKFVKMSGVGRRLPNELGQEITLPKKAGTSLPSVVKTDLNHESDLIMISGFDLANKIFE